MAMLPLHLLLVEILLPASLVAGQAAIPSSNPGGLIKPPASLVLELDRAIGVLRRGIKEHWVTRNQYFTAFEKTANTDAKGQSVAGAKRYVECAVGAKLRIHQVWDEGAPIEVEVNLTVVELAKLREDAAAELPVPPCDDSLPRRVRVSAGVEEGMLKTKVAPVCPGDAGVSGTVTLHAIISTESRVESLDVVSGPILLRGAALDAVRQWRFRPYLLNNQAVEVETTINVICAPGR